MEFVQPAHKIQLGRRNRPRTIIEAAATDAGQFGLSRQRQFVLAVDQRFALNSPTLVSALSKKSFSNVNCPILACRAFRSISGLAWDLSKIPAALSVNCRFQVVIWLGWTSNCVANSARVLSPAIAAKAAFALNAGECFRLVPFAIFCSMLCPSLGGSGSRFST